MLHSAVTEAEGPQLVSLHDEHTDPRAGCPPRTGRDHPVFLELIGSSFINGFFQSEPEKMGGDTKGASQLEVPYVSFAGGQA